MNWTFDGTASSNGALVNGAGTITASVPSATFPATACDYILSDATTGDSTAIVGCNYWSITGGGTSTVVVPARFDIHAGDRIQLVVQDVTNPSGAAAFSSATLATSSDSVWPRRASAGAFVPAQAVIGVTLIPDDTTASQASVAWTVRFTASASGQLTPGSGSVTVTSSVGTPFSQYLVDSSSQATVTDLRTGQSGTVPTPRHRRDLGHGHPSRRRHRPGRRRGRAHAAGGDQPGLRAFSDVSVATSSDSSAPAAPGPFDGTDVYAQPLGALSLRAAVDRRGSGDHLGPRRGGRDRRRTGREHRHADRWFHRGGLSTTAPAGQSIVLTDLSTGLSQPARTPRDRDGRHHTVPCNVPSATTS